MTEWLSRIRRLLGIRRECFPQDATVLDVGVGGRKRGTVGVDINTGEHVDVVGDGRDLPIHSESADAALCYHVAEHLDPRGVKDLFGELHRVTKPDGRVHVLVDRDTSSEALLAKDDTHVRRYSVPWLRKRAEWYLDVEVFQTHNLIGNVHNHPLTWPAYLTRATKVYIEGTPI